MKSIQHRLGLGLFRHLASSGRKHQQSSLWLFDLGLRRYLQGNLREEAEILLSALSRGANGPQLNEQRLSPRYQRPWSGSYFRIDLGDQLWRSRSAWDFSLDKPTTAGLSPALMPGPED